MDKQEIYDKVCAHLAQQGRRAMVGARCCFRADDGTKCAVGCLIPDELYKKDFESGGIGTLEFNYPEVLEAIGIDEHVLLCTDLQLAHDSNRYPRNLREDLASVAARYKLTPGAEQAITQWS